MTGITSRSPLLTATPAYIFITLKFSDRKRDKSSFTASEQVRWQKLDQPQPKSEQDGATDAWDGSERDKKPEGFYGRTGNVQ